MSLHDLLEPLRQQIDAIDDELVKLLNQRGALSLKIGQIKRRADSTLSNIHHRERELQIIQRLVAHNTGPLHDEQLTQLYELIFVIHRQLQAEIKDD